MTIAPIKHKVYTRAAPSKAFAIFTGQIGRWWPKGHGIGAQPLVEMVLEPGVGGRWFERDADGNETQWGRVLAWEPPARLILAWQLNREKRFDPNLITEVELTFTPAREGGTDVAFEHRNLERFGQDSAQWLAAIGGGWSQKLSEFAEFADLHDPHD